MVQVREVEGKWEKVCPCTMLWRRWSSWSLCPVTNFSIHSNPVSTQRVLSVVSPQGDLSATMGGAKEVVVGKGRVESWFTELTEHHIDGVKGCVYFLPNLMLGRRQGQMWCQQMDSYHAHWTWNGDHRHWQKALKKEKKCLFTLAPINTIFPNTKMISTTFGLIML